MGFRPESGGPLFLAHQPIIQAPIITDANVRQVWDSDMDGSRDFHKVHGAPPENLLPGYKFGDGSLRSVLEPSAESLPARYGSNTWLPWDRPVPGLNARIDAVKSDAWFVYILRCSDGSLYTGITTDVRRRTVQHNAGTASRYTRSHRPVHVVYQEPHTTRSLALKREAAVKRMTRMEKELLINRNVSGPYDGHT